MPLVPEAVVAMLACARIGAAHSVVFGGFSSEALRDRIQDARGEGAHHRHQPAIAAAISSRSRNSPTPPSADCPSIEHVVVVMRRSAAEELDDTVTMQPGRDRWYHELMRDAVGRLRAGRGSTPSRCSTRSTRAATTGKPKGIIHTTGGYLTGCYATCKWVFDLKEDDVYWCTADIGWVTGHSYVVYGPLAAGATVFVYEGAPDWPKQDRFWSLIEKHKVSIFYTAPTAIRAFMKWGDELPAGARSLVAAPPRIGRRTDQSRGLDVVPQVHRRRALPDRRHVVADRDRRDHDHAAARPRGDEARLGDARVSRHRREDPRREAATR